MNTILVPTDFSDNSLNSGKYALDLAQKVGAKKIVFYNTYTVPASVNLSLVPSESVLFNEDLIDFDSLQDTSMSGLKSYKEKLKDNIPANVEIELLPKYGILSDDINTTLEEVKADVIVMSVTGGGAFVETIIGSNTLNVAKQTHLPVIIVPSQATYKNIENILLLSDFVDIERTVPADRIKRILDGTKAKLNILHVAKNTQYTYNESSEERIVLEELFEGYHPHFHFTVDSDFIAGINHFVEMNKMDLVMIIPKKHSLLENIFIKNHTKILAFHSKIPMMVVHS